MQDNEFWHLANKYQKQLYRICWSWIPVAGFFAYLWFGVLNLNLPYLFMFGLLGFYMYINYRISMKMESLICPKCGANAFEGGAGFSLTLECKTCGLNENETTKQ